MVRLLVAAFFGNDSRYEVAGRDIEPGIVCWAVIGSNLDALDVGNFFGTSLFDWDTFAGFEGWVEGRGWGGDVERNLVVPREYGEHVGTDFVGGVAVGSDSVGSGDHAIDFSLGHEGGGHSIADRVEGDFVVEEFECGEAEALLPRASFAGPDVNVFALIVGAADDAEGGPVSSGGEGAGVADGHDVPPLPN